MCGYQPHVVINMCLNIKISIQVLSNYTYDCVIGCVSFFFVVQHVHLHLVCLLFLIQEEGVLRKALAVLSLSSQQANSPCH